MAKFLFSIKHKVQINNLVKSLGLTKQEACDFLYNYYNKKVTFAETFKSYLVSWLPNGENSEGKMNCLIEYKFPRRTVKLNLLAEKKDLNWSSLVL